MHKTLEGSRIPLFSSLRCSVRPEERRFNNNFSSSKFLMSLLLSPSINKAHVAFARNLNHKRFVEMFGIVHLNYNLHSLIHLADDCDFYQAPLDVFNCFLFESYLEQMKRKLRGRRLPIAQIKKTPFRGNTFRIRARCFQHGLSVAGAQFIKKINCLLKRTVTA